MKDFFNFIRLLAVMAVVFVTCPPPGSYASTPKPVPEPEVSACHDGDRTADGIDGQGCRAESAVDAIFLCGRPQSLYNEWNLACRANNPESSIKYAVWCTEMYFDRKGHSFAGAFRARSIGAYLEPFIKRVHWSEEGDYRFLVPAYSDNGDISYGKEVRHG